MRFQVVLNPELPETSGGVATNIDNLYYTRMWMHGHNMYVMTGKPNNHAEVYNMSGQEVMNIRFDYQIELPMQTLPTGVYVIRVNDERYKFINND